MHIYIYIVCIHCLHSKLAYFKVLDSGHLVKTSIAIISETVDRRAIQSSISTPRVISNFVQNAILRCFEKSKMAAMAETSIAVISETVDRRAKRSLISTPMGIINLPKLPFWLFWDYLKNPRWPPGLKLRLPLSQQPSIVEWNGARFRPRGQWGIAENAILAILRCSEKS